MKDWGDWEWSLALTAVVKAVIYFVAFAAYLIYHFVTFLMTWRCT